MNDQLQPLSRPLTIALARALIELDAGFTDREDVFVSWRACSNACASGAGRDAIQLLCPDGGAQLEGTGCTICGTHFKAVDGMLFLLPRAWREKVRSDGGGSTLPAEHL